MIILNGFHLLIIRPVQVGWAKQSTSGFVVKPSISFDVTSDRRIQGSSSWGDPVEYCAFQTFGVI